MPTKFEKIFASSKPIIGVIHVPALPGTPNHVGSVAALEDRVVVEADCYLKAGIDALIVENMHDVPYLPREVGPEITAMMTRLARTVKSRTALPVGIQILAGANRAALAVAQAAELEFIRAEGFVFGHLADEGWLNADAGSLLRYRKSIGAESIAIFTDIKKKHSAHAMSADVSLRETAEAAAFFQSDGLIVTGPATGQPAATNDLSDLYAHLSLPVLVGSGVNLQNVGDYLLHSDALIVGSWFKREGHWANSLDYDRVATFMTRVRQWRAREGQR
ncbi:MAG: BtpA/SgcQ family protein [Bacteroidota bacterium]